MATDSVTELKSNSEHQGRGSLIYSDTDMPDRIFARLTGLREMVLDVCTQRVMSDELALWMAVSMDDIKRDVDHMQMLLVDADMFVDSQNEARARVARKGKKQ